MNRRIAAALVGLSIVAGIGVGFAVQQSQGGPASAAPSPSATPTGPVGSEVMAGPVEVSDVFLVASKTGGATLVATLDLPGGGLPSIGEVTAEADGEPLIVVEGRTSNDDTAMVDAEDVTTRQLGRRSTSASGDVYEGTAFVVNGVEVGQRVRVTIELGDGVDGKPTPDAKLDVPVVSADVVPDAVLFDGPAPTFSDTTITLRPGEARAVIGYTVVSQGDEGEVIEPGTRIEGTGPRGIELEWKQQGTCCIVGPLVLATDEPRTLPDPTTEGTYDYVDAAGLKVGDTITFRFPFQSGLAEVPFEVVAG